MPRQRPNLTHPLAGAELAAGRVLWLPDFRQGSWGSSPRRDVAGRGNDGNLSGGPVWVPGVGYGMALTYDGSNDYCEVTSSADLDSTICTWAFSFRTSVTPSLVPIYLFGRVDAAASFNGVIFTLDVAGTITGGIKNGIDYVAFVTSAATYNDGRWHRVLLTVQDDALIELYIDGVSVGTDVPSGAWGFNGQVVRSAIGLDAFWEKFAGDMANESVWSQALTAAQVRVDYDRERQGRAPVRRMPLVQAFNTGGGSVSWSPTPDVEWELTAWVASASGSQGVTWTPPNVAWALTEWVATYVPTYSLSVVWAPPNVQWALTSWVTSVSQPPSTIRNPLVPRVPRSNPPEAMTRFTEKVSAILNGLSRYGQIVQFGPTEYRLFGAAYLVGRAPTADDDSSRGYFEGVTWINTGVSPRTAYLCTDATAGAATWLLLG